ncbi:DAPG hydrolase family protein [Parasporobacterium paucivorans]|uniref:DAPG hydrolase PhiG domain-containing protein n=1 Tax=Parasporobacterium paucivorans DSM 15970 TaxID=1122934 RepID=A0A1M6CTW9_9FIRM|nr:phloretin hydrolase [Parasporobacterium paucivorans]SHI64525.1 hypothetical protein SAMN02745691_00590 [Parasporobacterium paucivorans DSM 15970]
MKKVAVTREEKALPYYKYFNREMAEAPAEKVKIGEGPQNDPRNGVKLEDRNKYLSGEAPGFEVGFCVMENGTGLVANKTFMQGVTGEMLDWWFPWHSVGSDLRYKIWDNEDHYFAKADKVEYVVDPNVPNSQKTWGVNHQILEDIGSGPEPLLLCFKRPKDMGFDESILGTEKCASLVCGYGIGTPAIMVHKWYPVEGGVMFESRFWIGYTAKDGEFIKVVPEGQAIPEIVTRKLFQHNIKEYTNLANFLPEIYAEEKDNF